MLYCRNIAIVIKTIITKVIKGITNKRTASIYTLKKSNT